MDIERAFRILGLGLEASLVQAKRSFRLLSRKYHPDRTGTDATSRKYKLVVDAYRAVQDFIENGAPPDEDDEIELGSALNVVELLIGGEAVPLDSIRSLIIQLSQYDNDSGITFVLTFVEPWEKGVGRVVMVVEMDGEYARFSALVLGISSDGRGAVSQLELEPVF